MTIERLRDAAARTLSTMRGVLARQAPARDGRERTTVVPRAALVLGEGIDLGAAFTVDARIDLSSYGATVTLGRIAEVPVASVSAAARLAEIADRVRVLGLVGADPLIMVACGRPLAQGAPADVLIVADHMNLLGDNPLRGANLDELGPRFPDMTEAYDHTLVAAARDAAADADIAAATGVLVAVPDPSRRTPEEYEKLRRLGADWVAGDVVPETIVARHMGARVVALVEREGGGGRAAAAILRSLLPRLQG